MSLTVQRMRDKRGCVEVERLGRVCRSGEIGEGVYVEWGYWGGCVRRVGILGRVCRSGGIGCVWRWEIGEGV